MKNLVINKNALEHNIKYIKNNLQDKVMFCAVVKSNAYGHGLSKIVEYTKNQVDYYAVIDINEALTIRTISVDKPILILGKLDTQELEMAILNNIEISIFDLQYLKIINKLSNQLKKKVKLHIKVNTGMNRLGIKTKAELLKMIEYCNCNSNLLIKGIYTHFATPHNEKYLNKQVQIWQSILLSIDTSKYIIHASASAIALKKYNLQYNMVRVGLAMYGYGDTNLQPVLSVHSKIMQINKLKKGDFVGYDAKFIAKKNTVIGVVGIGYGDGYMRANATKGYVLINGNKCKIIGKICMNLLFVDLSTCINVQIGDIAVIIGKSKDKEITATHLSKWCDTIEYEILTNFSK